MRGSRANLKLQELRRRPRDQNDLIGSWLNTEQPDWSGGSHRRLRPLRLRVWSKGVAGENQVTQTPVVDGGGEPPDWLGKSHRHGNY